MCRIIVGGVEDVELYAGAVNDCDSCVIAHASWGGSDAAR